MGLSSIPQTNHKLVKKPQREILHPDDIPTPISEII